MAIIIIFNNANNVRAFAGQSENSEAPPTVPVGGRPLSQTNLEQKIYSFNTTIQCAININLNGNNFNSSFLIDSQAEISITKFNEIQNPLSIDNSELINVRGVTSGVIQTISFVRNDCKLKIRELSI